MGDDPLDSGLSSSSSSSSSSSFSSPSSSPKQTTLLQPPSDDYIDVDEGDDDDYDDDENDNELKSQLGCPFCFKAFDPVGLFCHIDDVHPIETKSGICPVCGRNLGTNLAAHLSTQHDIILKALHKKILCDGDFDSVESFLRKELKDEYLQLKGSSSVVTSSKLAPDPLLSSFVYNVSLADEPEIVQPCSSTNANLSESMLERDIQTIPLSEKDQEKAQRCEFVHSILFSTIHDDNL